ncbi:MAG: ComF family protein [Porticoccaceae bacterium]
MKHSKPLEVFAKEWRRHLNNLGYRLFPGHCLLCNRPSGRKLDLCADCETDLPFNKPACQRCALPLPTVALDNALCGRCQASPPAFQCAVVPLLYEFPVDRLVNAFKHRGAFSRGALMAEILLRELRGRNEQPQLIAPVPLHWRRQFQRGFNQAGWLARYLGRQLDIPVEQGLFSRLRHTDHQQGQSRKQRLANLKGAFSLNKVVTGKTIALVDDVMTTGSTLQSLAKLLNGAGASAVEVWCLVRTPLEK